MSSAGERRRGFELLRTEGAARRGRLHTAHGAIETPAFMPVGTLGAVKGLGPSALEEAGAQVMLANLYHLSLRPGIARVAKLGGLHAFSGWTGPLLTDSGGFQVFSLTGLRRVDENGVTFRSVHDGSLLRFEPEGVVQAQAELGVDLAMVLDECPPWPVDFAHAEAAWRRTQQWAERSREAQQRLDPGAGLQLFGIVQGSFFPELRERAVESLVPLGFDGYAIGGVSVGEEKALGREVAARAAGALPPDRPRYLMGVGTPADIAAGVAAGVDLFDCVLPSRNARHAFVWNRDGALRLKGAAFRDDPRPIDERCHCSTCRRCSRAFLHHLFRTGEITAQVLATVHNVRFYLDFMGQLREALELGNLAGAASAALRAHEPERSRGDHGRSR